MGAVPDGLLTYEEDPGVGLTAYIAIATANGEDFFTRVIAHNK